MFDVIDAVLYYPSNAHIYFFKGPHYIKYRPGHGVVLLSGREVRSTGVDGWESFPAQFCTGIDAALYYEPNGHAYFFKGSHYIKYKPGDGVVPLGDGRLVRNIGQDGWQTFPTSFVRDIDAALFYPDNGHAYFFKGGEYLKYRPNHGVVPLDGRQIRKIGEDGWTSFPADFRLGIDGATHYPPRGKTYFFRKRDYLRWQPGEGVDARYPRRIGLLHRDHGGWPGLSHVVAGPLVGPVTETRASLWIWLTDRETAAALSVDINGVAHPVVKRDPADPALVGAMDAINAGSCLQVLEVQGLTPGTQYVAQIMLGTQELDRVSFVTRPAAAHLGKVRFVFGSCADMSINVDVPAFTAMASAKPDFALFCGDNCYYVNGELTTGRTGPAPRDWESKQRMLKRQVEARNHPQFAILSRSVPCYSTWDDHDFAYNNAHGTDLFDGWVGPVVAGAVFRGMWPNPYAQGRADQAIYYSFRWGPLDVFMTDNRFHKDGGAHAIWGNAQLAWLIDGLKNSQAAVKIVVTSGQFLYNNDSQEGHARQAEEERSALLNSIVSVRGVPPAIRGRVLFLSGDVHYSELLRLSGKGAANILEFTSSPMRRDIASGNPPAEKVADSRIWAAKRNGFGMVTVNVRDFDVKGRVTGSITLEARDKDGDLISSGGVPCRSVWDLATGVVS